MKHFILIGIFMTILSSTRTAAASPSSMEDAHLASYFKNYLDQLFKAWPTEATLLGDHRFDDRLDDVSADHRAQWKAHLKETLAAMPREIDYDKLSANGKVDYEIWRHELTKSLWVDENTKPFETDPRCYGHYISDSVYALLTQSTLPQETNIEHCIARMKEIPKVVAAAKQSLTRPPLSVLETAIGQNRGAISFFENDIFTVAGETRQANALHSAAQNVVACLKDYEKFLETDLRARADGPWRLGSEKFSKKLDLELDAGLTAEEVLTAATADFQRVQRELYIIARQLWGHYYAGQAFPPDNEEGHAQTVRKVIHAVEQEHGRPEDLIVDGRATVDHIRDFIRKNKLLHLPEPDRCQVIEMPEFKRGNSTAYMENSPPLDVEAASFYAISPPPKDWSAAKVKSLLEEYNRHMLQVLTIHEAYPGHYVQIEHGNRNPSLVRRVFGSGAYIEGWAVYTEQMMLDQGYGDGSLQLRLMQLKFLLRAVTNSILDHKMHCTEMTDDEAMDLLVRQAYQNEGEARLKIIRAKQTSCQLSTYFVGRTAHCRLRTAIQTEMGPKFNLCDYHDAVLRVGAVPVKYLPKLVRAELERGK